MSPAVPKERKGDYKIVSVRRCVRPSVRRCVRLHDLKEKLKITVEKAFKGGTNQYIRITTHEASWHHSKRSDTVSKEEIFTMIDIVVDNSYFRFGDRVYRQCIGIPMGIDPAPQMANLYLYYY